MNATRFYVVRKANPTGPVYVAWREPLANPGNPTSFANVQMISFTVNDGRSLGRTTTISEKEFCETFQTVTLP
jgi:hypothetical protein